VSGRAVDKTAKNREIGRGGWKMIGTRSDTAKTRGGNSGDIHINKW